MQRPPPKYSIVIPAFNEAARLPRALEKIRAYLMERNLHAEIVVVDDGSSGRDAEIVRDAEFEAGPTRCAVCGWFRMARIAGRATACATGCWRRSGEIALFTDADLSAPIEEFDKLLAASGNADVAFGSRAVDRRLISVHQSRLREIAGIIFNGFRADFYRIAF